MKNEGNLKLMVLSSALALAGMPVAAQDTNAVAELRKQLQEMQESFEKQRQQMEALQKQLEALEQRQATPTSERKPLGNATDAASAPPSVLLSTNSWGA